MPKIYFTGKTAFQLLLLRNSDIHIKKGEIIPIPRPIQNQS